MRLFRIILLLTVITLLTSFKKTDSPFLLGKVWVYENYNLKNQNATYKRANSFSKYDPGFQFLENGKLKKRQNKSWCGTPPITYETVEGNWKQLSDSVVLVNYKLWQEVDMSEKLKIKTLAKNRLIIQIIAEEE